MKIRKELSSSALQSKINRLWQLSGEKIDLINTHYDESIGSPVFTSYGRYTARGWTEWTEGFRYGAEILQFDATGDTRFLEMGRKHTIDRMASHVSHIGVHDHGFNNVSTYGNLLRLMNEGRIPENRGERNFYELALKLSGAVQASRWSTFQNGGYIHSFNGPHSLFVDTIRSVRALMVSHLLGHRLMGENDTKISLLGRGTLHALATARYSVYYGEGRDSYDQWGRTAHESVFNRTDGNYRCPNSQQGFSGFTTWTRGLAWAMLGFAEQLESLPYFDVEELQVLGGKETIEDIYLKAARATCDFYIDHTALDGIPYWDTGAPQLYKLGDYQSAPSDPYNDFEPIDSSAAAIGAQGLLRLGNYLMKKGAIDEGERYWQAGLTVVDTLFDEPYLSANPEHQGLLLHSIYHRPNGWDTVPSGRSIPCGESSMWGDYHAREVALYLDRVNKGLSHYSYLGAIQGIN